MRRELKKLDGERMRFVGTVERFGTKPAFRGPDIQTILLVNVYRNDRQRADLARRVDEIFVPLGVPAVAPSPGPDPRLHWAGPGRPRLHCVRGAPFNSKVSQEVATCRREVTDSTTL